MTYDNFKWSHTRKQVLTMVLVFAAFLTATISPYIVYAAGKVNQEHLISNITNPSSGRISFYLNIPAGKTVNYKVELIPNKRTGSIDTIRGNYKNSGRLPVSKQITVPTKYYSNRYTITASYTVGPTRNQTIYKDIDSATSALKTTVYTRKFVWDEYNIKRWQAGQRVSVALSFAITGSVDILATKGYLSGSLATVLGLAFFAGDTYSAGTVTDTKTITLTPIKGWGYKFKYQPYSGGYSRHLLIYDAKGSLHQTINWGKIPLSTISLAVR